MPWKVSDPVSERMQFVMRLQQGERMTDLCREFGISRKTGHKIWSRYQQIGVDGLKDQSRRPKRIPHKTADEIEQVLVAARQAHPTWGGRKLKAWLERQQPGVRFPAPSSIGGILQRHGLVNKRRRRGDHWSHTGLLRTPQAPNDVWAVDYKGQFRLGNRAYCYPLTSSDLVSRYVLTIEALEGTDEAAAHEAFEGTFRTYGLPWVIRSDNGPPFASKGLRGWTQLSVWWLRLGIVHERIKPAHPEQNAIHERMHRTLKAETTRPAAPNALQQQERFDGFRVEFNEQRPHEALDDKTPSDVYQRSPRPFPQTLPDPTYPTHDDTLLVSRSGHLRLPRRRAFFLGTALAGQLVGLREQDDARWLVTFLDFDLGTYDPRMEKFEASGPDHPLALPDKVLPMCPV